MAGGLKSLGFEGLGEVRVGKVIDLKLNEDLGPEAALDLGRDMARRLLANEVVEDFDVQLVD